ncbi:hypothetical protein ACQJBY_019890 [Aegilops geniculata]
MATATTEGRGRQRASPDRLPVPPRPSSRSRSRSRSRYRHRAPPRPTPGSRHAQGRPRAEPYKGSPLAAFIYLCAALGVAVAIRLCATPPPSHSMLRAYRGLAAAVVGALITVLFLRHPPRWADQEYPDGPSQIPAAHAPAPQIQPEQPRLAPTATLTLTGGILDASQVAAAIRSSMADSTRPTPAVSPPQADSSDSDSDDGGSSTNGDDINNFWYTPVHLLKAGDACLFLPDFIQQLQLQEMAPGLTEAESLELLRRALRDANKSDGFHRLSDVVEGNQWIIYSDPHALTDRPTGTLVMTMKITAKLVHLIWYELDVQNWKLCQEVKKVCFQEVVGQSVEKLLDVALSFSNGSWSADHPLPMLTTFDALVDVLHNIRELPFSRIEFIPDEVADIPDLPCSRYESIHNVVAHIFCKMVVDLKGILEGTTNGRHISRECAIHPATALLVRYLEFFFRNGEMLQSVLGTRDCTIELIMIGSWVSKLSEDAEVMFPGKGQRCIYMLNNMDYVYQLKHHPGGFLSNIELQRGLCSLIHQYIKGYLEEYWFPLMLSYLDGDSLKKPRRSSLYKFTEEFFRICDGQMTWKVRTKLKQRLREQIVELIVPKYVTFLEALQDNPSSWLKRMCRARSEKLVRTAARLEEVIRGLFER